MKRPVVRPSSLLRPTFTFVQNIYDLRVYLEIKDFIYSSDYITIIVKKENFIPYIFKLDLKKLSTNYK